MDSKRQQLIIINKNDTVAVALGDYPKGSHFDVNGETLRLENDIPFGHKVALRNIPKGENIFKYGAPIGHASTTIPKGSHVHTHNVKTNLSDVIEYAYSPAHDALEAFARDAEHVKRKGYAFDGYMRPDGRAGTRNEVWILPLVGCVNNTADNLAAKAREAFGSRCDGVFAYTHNMGCSQLGDDMLTTQKILAGIINNPNAGGVLVLGLGCENNHLEVFRPVLESLGPIDENRVKFLVTQDVENEIGEGLKLLDALTAHAAKSCRERIPVSALTIGFKCGGSDAFSGITANALCGVVNDTLVKAGGSTILTEVPEMFGAETLLMERAVDKDTFEATVDLINEYKHYFTRYGQVIYENPSPGNKKGGITTLEEKSLGCTQKGGTAPVTGVLGYGEPAVKKGLNLLTGSGNDQVSCTNLVASGATMILFTTGRGNPFGAPVPTVKIASNDRLYERKKNWIDCNAGKILTDGMEKTAEIFFSYILDVASGKKSTLNEMHGYRDISIFRDGVIL